MIFDVSPSQIERLSSFQLVELLRKLLHAEAQNAGISLRSVSAPLQITIADGGEDARVHWSGGNDNTNYFPCRLNIFQSKATDPGPTGWKKEVWTKSSQRDGVSRVLNDAVAAAIAGHGAYIGFTSAAIAGNKLSNRLARIKDGIREAGGDPDDLACVDIYDANRIAAWVGQHPAVAVWLNEAQLGLPLGGFQTIEGWGRRADFSTINPVDDTAPRYGILNTDIEQRQSGNTLNAHQAKERIFDYIAQSKRCVRIFGPSGLGKSRFVYELFRDQGSVEKYVAGISTIYCDFRSIGQARLHQVAEALANSGTSVLLIVDECSRESAFSLSSIVFAANSRLRLITIDIDDRPISTENVLNISVAPSNDELVEGIIRQRAPTTDASTITYLKNSCSGFPRIAVLATDSHLGGLPALNSIEDVVDRVLKGCGLSDRDQLRAIECLSLFERVGSEGEVAEQLDIVASRLARQSGDEMYEHLSAASKHQLVDRRGRFFIAQPLPIAAFLGARRIDLLRIESILQFIYAAPQELVLPFLQKWRYFDLTRTAVEAAERLMKREGRFGSLDALNNEFGSQCLDALSHVAPDAAAETVQRVFGGLTLHQLQEASEGRRHLVWTLERLVFRRQTFHVAARMLMRLAAVETESWSNNATGQFKQLFQLELSGTEVEPAERFAVIDDGIVSGDERIIGVCIEAIAESFADQNFSRTSGAEEIGTQPPLRDWQPKTIDDVIEFRRQGLVRLERVRTTQRAFEKRCVDVLAENLRALICEPLIDEIEAIVTEIAQKQGVWLDGIEAVGNWLYFERTEYPDELQIRVHGLYNRLMPTDQINLAILYAKFWPGRLHNPELAYNQSLMASVDFEYSTRKAVETAILIAQDQGLAERSIREMAPLELNNIYPFAYELGKRAADPFAIFKMAVDIIRDSDSLNGFRLLLGMLGGVDDQDSSIADNCIKLALDCDKLMPFAIDIRAAVKISTDRLTTVIANLEAGLINPASCVQLSYGQRLDNLSADQILPLIDELTKHGVDGAWSALEIATMYRRGQNSFDAELVDRAKRLLVSPVLLERGNQVKRESNLFESVAQSIHRHGGIDDTFVIGLGEQFVRFCQLNDSEIFRNFKASIRKLISLLVFEKPLVLWEVISQFVERATPIERRRLNQLVEYSRHGFHRNENRQSDAGSLFGIPDEACFRWADADAPNRASFLCEFYPLFHWDTNGVYMWHPAMETLAVKYGEYDTFRAMLDSRLHITAWSGSLIPLLERYFDPLAAWYSHPVSQISRWAKEKRRALDGQISTEKKREEEGF